MISFPCICGENWFCRRSVATFQSDVIQGPERGLFATIFRIRAPFSRDRYPPFSRRRKTSPQRRRNPFPRAGISFSGYAAAPPSPGDVPLFSLRRSSPDGSLSFLRERSPTGARPDLTHILCNPFRALPDRTSTRGRPGSAAFFFLSIYPQAHHCAIM